jgi:hypothetical protein
MVQYKNARTVVLRNWVNKDLRTTVQAAEVTEANIETIRTAWHKPDAQVGQYLVKANMKYKIVDAGHFLKKYRRPIGM